MGSRGSNELVLRWLFPDFLSADLRLRKKDGAQLNALDVSSLWIELIVTNWRINQKAEKSLISIMEMWPDCMKLYEMRCLLCWIVLENLGYFGPKWAAELVHCPGAPVWFQWGFQIQIGEKCPTPDTVGLNHQFTGSKCVESDTQSLQIDQVFVLEYLWLVTSYSLDLQRKRNLFCPGESCPSNTLVNEGISAGHWCWSIGLCPPSDLDTWTCGRSKHRVGALGPGVVDSVTQN